MYICQTNYILLCFAEIPFNFMREKSLAKFIICKKFPFKLEEKKEN